MVTLNNLFWCNDPHILLSQTKYRIFGIRSVIRAHWYLYKLSFRFKKHLQIFFSTFWPFWATVDAAKYQAAKIPATNWLATRFNNTQIILLFLKWAIISVEGQRRKIASKRIQLMQQMKVLTCLFNWLTG